MLALLATLALSAPPLDADAARAVIAACRSGDCPDRAALSDAVFADLVDRWVNQGLTDGQGAADLREVDPAAFDALPTPVRNAVTERASSWVRLFLNPPAPRSSQAFLKIIGTGTRSAAPTRVDLEPDVVVVRATALDLPSAQDVPYRVACRADLGVASDGTVLSVQTDPASCPPSFDAAIRAAMPGWQFAPVEPDDRGPWLVQREFTANEGLPVRWEDVHAPWAAIAEAHYRELRSDSPGCVVALDVDATGAITAYRTNDSARCLAWAREPERLPPFPAAGTCALTVQTARTRPTSVTADPTCDPAVRDAALALTQALWFYDLDGGAETYDLRLTVGTTNQ